MPALTKCQIMASFARHCASIVAEMGSHEVIGSTIECSHRDGRLIVLERTGAGWLCRIGSEPAHLVATVEDLDRILGAR